MTIRLRSDIFIKELLLFWITLGVGMLTAYRSIFQVGQRVSIEPVEFSWGTVAIMVISFFVVSRLITRKPRWGAILLRVFMFLIVFSGIQLVLATFVSWSINLIVSLLLTLAMWYWPRVITHNVAMSLALAGIAAVIGLSITPIVGLFVLATLSLYDIIAVYRTGHMVQLARTMIASGAVFGFIIPRRWHNFFLFRDQARIGDEFMVLGSGDIALPVMFVCSVVTHSLISAAIVGLFASLGLLLTHLIFVNQSQRRAMAALPPIAMMTILGYAVSLLF